MELRLLSGSCFGGTCPAVYATDRDTIVVQGKLVNDTGVTPSDGEALVEIPAELLRQAADA
jgi:hypothetical protein